MATLEKFFLLAVTLFMLLVDTNGLEGDPCLTPVNERGRCLEVKQCGSINTTLKQESLEESTGEAEENSQCGFKNTEPLVCCSTVSSTPKSEKPSMPDIPLVFPDQETLFSNNNSPQEAITDVTGHKNVNLLRNDICGIGYDSRLLDGNTTMVDEFPWMALIAYSSGGGNQFKCSGTVINERYVLTAAHCVKFLSNNLQPVSVRLGEYNLDDDVDCDDLIDRTCAEPPQDIPIEEVIPHPEYIGKPNLQNDIALIRLAKSANFTPESVRPICLPIGLKQQAQDLTGRKVLVSGWSKLSDKSSPRVVLKLPMSVVSHSQCFSIYKSQVNISATSHICAGGAKEGEELCAGSGGSPLTYRAQIDTEARVVQFGIVSFGPAKCGTAGFPGVYTRVGYFMDWILNNIRE